MWKDRNQKKLSLGKNPRIREREITERSIEEQKWNYNNVVTFASYRDKRFKEILFNCTYKIRLVRVSLTEVLEI
jgi:hypothetical protein